MRVTVLLFAGAQAAAGRPAVEVELSDGATVGDLRVALAGAVPALEPLGRRLLIALDQDYAGDDLPIRPGAEIAAFPPVSGGAPESRSTLRMTG